MAGSIARDATVVLTGATSGLGRHAALELAERGATVAAVGRDEARGRELVDAAADAPGAVAFHRTDLADFDAVRELADDLREEHGAIDVLALNAGLSRSERTLGPEGVELAFAVNHLAHYLLTRELLDELRAGGLVAEAGDDAPADASSRPADADSGSADDGTAPSRVVVTASGLHRRGELDLDDLAYESGEYSAIDAYARSKLANVAFTLELAARFEAAGDDVVANCFTPGFVPGTRIWRDLPLHRWLAIKALGLLPGVGGDAERGGELLVELATDPRFAERTGRYVDEGEVVEPAAAARDPDLRTALWERSAALVGVDPDWA